MDAVERVGRAREADGLDVVELQVAGCERLARRDPGELLPGLLGSPDELRHPGADDGDARAHRRITATAAELEGTPRHDCATPTAASPARSRSTQARALASPLPSRRWPSPRAPPLGLTRAGSRSWSESASRCWSCL